MPNRTRTATTLVVCMLSIAQTRPPTHPAPAVRVERPVPFSAGETLTYDVSWSGLLSAGTATLSVLEKRRSFDSVAYYIVAEARPSGLLSRMYTLYYKLDTLLDVYTLLPQRGSIYSEEGKRRRYKSLRFDQARRTATYELRTATVVTRNVELPPACQDALSALYALRAMPLKANDRVTIPVADSGKVYQVQFIVTGSETVKTGFGPVNAWRIVPAIQGAQGQDSGIVLWVTNDGRRLPVRIQVGLTVGTFELALRKVN